MYYFTLRYSICYYFIGYYELFRPNHLLHTCFLWSFWISACLESYNVFSYIHMFIHIITYYTCLYDKNVSKISCSYRLHLYFSNDKHFLNQLVFKLSSHFSKIFLVFGILICLCCACKMFMLFHFCSCVCVYLNVCVFIF